ncbi:aminoglycoside 3'-phosphotransferase/choline kinase family protein [Bradyrhizobium sp. Ai1a-2]|uniref:aminoglycoside phosphotransferase family protein n=1 Tax=Bradyrhizobium sp. Ai1a-2 TaxID=196490 RepID=UPI000402A9FA|nr:aminoglycoside 3'-phosphotransferase/choline kinase family protein [Bradyrhizobium sp. Ai1a-2]
MTQSLPTFTTHEIFRVWRADPSRWLPVAMDIARSHGIASAPLQVFTTGTNLVVGLDDQLILKIFPPMLRAQYTSERASLAQLRGQVKIPIPEIVAEGEREGWPYLITTRVPGVLGADVWASLPEADKERVLAEIGETIADVQRVPPGPLLEIEPRWDVFMQSQMEGCRARHERLGLAQQFLDGLDDLLRDAAELIPMREPPVILTGEYIPQNFMLTQRDGRWQLCGLIDFGDVLTGWRDYDLLGPGAFMAAGRPRRVLSLLEGFGYSRSDIDFALKRRLMALMLLHRASDLNRHICIEGWQAKADDLVQLQELIWAT